MGNSFSGLLLSELVCFCMGFLESTTANESECIVVILYHAIAISYAIQHNQKLAVNITDI